MGYKKVIKTKVGRNNKVIKPTSETNKVTG
jgi:hypothetical protein